MMRRIGTCSAVAAMLLSAFGPAIETCHGYTMTDWMRLWQRGRGTSTTPVVAAPTNLWPFGATTTQPQVVVPPSAVAPMIVPGPTCAGTCGTPVPACGTAGCGTPYPTCGVPAPTCGTAIDCTSRGVGVPTVQVPANAPATVVGYVPQVRYRLTWLRVPTTNYCPVNSVDPASGTVTTAMRPCTTYTWQLRQVPEHSATQLVQRTLAAPVTVVAGTAGAFGGTTVLPTAAYAPVVGNCTTCPSAVPYYSAPAGAAPTLAPGMLAPPATGSSIYGAPSGAGAPAASQPPSLSPADLQRLQQPPATSEPTTRYFAPTVNPMVNPSSNGSSAPVTTGAANKPVLKLVPDPEAGLHGQPSSSSAAPLLFDPTDKTAQRPVQMIWSYSPIVWPQVTPVSGRETLSERVSTSEPALRQVAPSTPPSSFGWQSVSP